MNDIYIINGDCVDKMRRMPANSVDSIVTDPPYGLEFMGKEWDSPEMLNEHGWKHNAGAGMSKCGLGDRKTAWVSYGSGAALKFGGGNPTCKTCGGRSRGKTTCQCDTPDYWCNGVQYAVDGSRADGESAPSKSASVGKAFQDWCLLWCVEAFRVLKPGGHIVAFGGTRMYHRLACAIEDAGFESRDCIMWVYGSGFPKNLDVSKALDKKAGAEREVIGVTNQQRRKGNMGKAGVLNNRGPGLDQPTIITAPASDEAKQWAGWGTCLKPAYEPAILARKPLSGTVAANVLKHGTGAINIDGCRVGPAFVSAGGNNFDAWRKGEGRDDRPAQHARMTEKRVLGRFPANLIHDGSEEATRLFPATSAGSASRFFYEAKANKKDRETGNSHPTVKPTDLMRYLVRLVTPPGGIVLDPFAGSGSTGKAARKEGFRFIGIEQSAEYCAIALARCGCEKAVTVKTLKRLGVLQ